jgi:hypothetical protein
MSARLANASVSIKPLPSSSEQARNSICRARSERFHGPMLSW